MKYSDYSETLVPSIGTSLFHNIPRTSFERLHRDWYNNTREVTEKSLVIYLKTMTEYNVYTKEDFTIQMKEPIVTPVEWTEETASLHKQVMAWRKKDHSYQESKVKLFCDKCGLSPGHKIHENG